MTVKHLVTTSYSTVDAFSGTSQVENELLEHGYLVVFDEGKYAGILTPHDVLCRPHKLVIDCLTRKEQVHSDDSLDTALNRLNQTNAKALPVFDDGRYTGVIVRDDIVVSLQNRTKSLQNRTKELREKLQLARQLKNSFLTNLSHEVRTPLNGILPLIETLSELQEEDAQSYSPELIELLETTMNRFLRVMEDLIELSLIESGQHIELLTTEIDLETMFEELVSETVRQPQFAEKKLAIQSQLRDATLRLETDEIKLKRVFAHLIQNAMKFCTDESVVTFGVKRIESTKVSFFVSNTGDSIVNRNRIFRMFEREKNSPTHFSEGLGVGLAISQKLVELLGGNIKVLQENLNQTMFEFSVLLKLDDHQKE